MPAPSTANAGKGAPLRGAGQGGCAFGAPAIPPLPALTLPPGVVAILHPVGMTAVQGVLPVLVAGGFY